MSVKNKHNATETVNNVWKPRTMPRAIVFLFDSMAVEMWAAAIQMNKHSISDVLQDNIT